MHSAGTLPSACVVSARRAAVGAHAQDTSVERCARRLRLLGVESIAAPAAIRLREPRERVLNLRAACEALRGRLRQKVPRAVGADQPRGAPSSHEATLADADAIATAPFRRGAGREDDAQCDELGALVGWHGPQRGAVRERALGVPAHAMRAGTRQQRRISERSTP